MGDACAYESSHSDARPAPARTRLPAGRCGKLNSGTRIPVIGYASSQARGAAARRDLERQAAVIVREAAGRGLQLIEIVHEQEPTNGKALARPGLTYALECIVAAHASGLVVSEL